MIDGRKRRLAAKVLQESKFQQTAGKKISVQVLLAGLKACSRRQDLQRGKEIHGVAVACGHDSNIYLMSTLVRMYAKCGSIADARCVFDNIQKPDVVAWTALLLGYAENGQGLVALDMFSQMKVSGCAPNSVTYMAALKACTSLAVDGNASGKKNCLERGKEIHLEIGSNLNHYVQNTLIDMYAKCCSMVDARCVFDSMQEPDVVSWTSLLLGYAENGECFVALDMFSRMKASGCAPDSITYIGVLRACTSLAVDGDASRKRNCLEWGREIHLEIGSNVNHCVQSALIDMYAKCNSMADARQVFDGMQKPDVVCWNALLLGYAENWEGLVALHLFSSMKASGCTPDSVTYIAALKACTSLAVDVDGSGKKNCLEWGREVHSEVGSNLDHHIQNTLIDMYAKCGSMVDAHRVFSSMQKPDVVSWNALLLGYAENGEGLVVLDLFPTMKATGCVPDALTYIAALKSCGLIGALAFGRELHSEITVFTAHLVTCLVDFYGKCGNMLEAHGVFHVHRKERTISTWNALLAGYGRSGDTDSAFNLFEAMQDDGFQPNAVTFVCMLSCCSHAGLVEKARAYFEEMDVRYRVSPTVMHYNCMVDVLGRANLLNEAVGLIWKMPCNPDTATWMALLGACCKWKNVEIGRMAFESLLSSQLLVGKADKVFAPAHVLMADIYGSNGLRVEQERVMERLEKLPGRASSVSTIQLELQCI